MFQHWLWRSYRFGMRNRTVTAAIVAIMYLANSTKGDREIQAERRRKRPQPEPEPEHDWVF
jgi:hypothetical protein